MTHCQRESALSSFCVVWACCKLCTNVNNMYIRYRRDNQGLKKNKYCIVNVSVLLICIICDFKILLKKRCIAIKLNFLSLTVNGFIQDIFCMVSMVNYKKHKFYLQPGFLMKEIYSLYAQR